jgi:hypothetical protein
MIDGGRTKTVGDGGKATVPEPSLENISRMIRRNLSHEGESPKNDANSALNNSHTLNADLNAKQKQAKKADEVAHGRADTMATRVMSSNRISVMRTRVRQQLLPDRPTASSPRRNRRDLCRAPA